jgi:hypothetical protein
VNRSLANLEMPAEASTAEGCDAFITFHADSTQTSRVMARAGFLVAEPPPDRCRRVARGDPHDVARFSARRRVELDSFARPS